MKNDKLKCCCCGSTNIGEYHSVILPVNNPAEAYRFERDNTQPLDEFFCFDCCNETVPTPEFHFTTEEFWKAMEQ